MRLTLSHVFLLVGFAYFDRAAFADDPARAIPHRRMLVELYTSQGCDMCPEAERLLGVLSGGSAQVVPVGFHADYFNNPWKDPFSHLLHSQRQASYNEIGTAAQHRDYGLCYTPMIMVDGEESLDGRDLVGVQQPLARAAKSKSHFVLIFRLVIA